MREVNSTPEIKPISKIDKKVKTPETQTEKTSFEGGKEVKDFSNPKMEALGRSQVKMSKADNIEKDLLAFTANPEKVMNAEKFFDLALASAEKKGDKNPYETAALQTGLYSQEVLGLKV